MKRPIALSLLLLMLAASGAGAVDHVVRHCDFAVKSRCASGDAEVTLNGTAVTRIGIDVVWCGQAGSPGYTCTIDSSRGDRDSKWSDDGAATIIANTAPFTPGQPDQIRVTVGRNVSIDLKQTQSVGRCGAGAELPQAIVIPAHGQACHVWLPKP